LNPFLCRARLALVLVAALAGAASGQQFDSPLIVTDTAGDGVVTLSLDKPQYDALAGLAAIDLSGFVLTKDLVVDLALTRFEVFAPDAQVITVTAEGQAPGARPNVQLWRGGVANKPDSHVFLALTPHGTNGYVEVDGTTYIISSGQGGVMPTVIYDLNGPAGRGIQFDLPACAGAILQEGDVAPAPTGPANPYESRVFTCRNFRIAVDCDNEFTSSLFSGNTTNSQAYATSLLGAVSEIYQRDTNMTLQLAYLRTWTATDPYTSTNTGDQLPQFRTYWQSNMGSVSRNLAHMFSGRGLGGGIAYLRAVCTTNGYGVSANLNGSFPYPIRNNSGQNWDLMVVSHELGHNFGSGHTHDLGSYNPIIDGCGSNPQNCTAANQGTIMSYCHTCPGGMSNMLMTFGPRVITAIRTYLDTSAINCGTYPSSGTYTQQPASVALNAGLPVSFSATVTGGNPSAYRWQKDGADLVNDGRIAGATTTTLTINPTQSSDTGEYALVTTTSCGALESNPADLIVQTCPTFLRQPADVTVAVGGLVSINVAASGTNPRTYQWRRNGVALSDGDGFFGTGLNAMSIQSATLADAGEYDVLVSNVCGSNTSQAATVTITTSPCGSADFDGDGDSGTDTDIEAFFACLGGNCCATCGSSDFDGDGDSGTDTDIEAFFRVLGGGNC